MDADYLYTVLFQSFFCLWISFRLDHNAGTKRDNVQSQRKSCLILIRCINDLISGIHQIFNDIVRNLSGVDNCLVDIYKIHDAVQMRVRVWNRNRQNCFNALLSQYIRNLMIA